jgi:hypothetical protein
MLSQMSPVHTLTPNLFITYFSNIIPVGLLDLGSPSNTKSKFIVVLILIGICADGVTKDCELKCRKHPAKCNLLLSANIWTLLHLLRTHLLLAVCYDFSPKTFDETSIL